MAKSKPVAPKPILAWCALYVGKIVPGWCCSDRETARLWSGNIPNGKLIRVEIRPAPKRQEHQSWWTRVLASVDAMQAMVDKYGVGAKAIALERAKLMTILVEQVPAPKRKGATKP